eukprot:9231999-Prorocentrum_lima.AAC.1
MKRGDAADDGQAQITWPTTGNLPSQGRCSVSEVQNHNKIYDEYKDYHDNGINAISPGRCC